MKRERGEILRKLMHVPKMGFNELWGNEGESNKFAYHLRVLVEDGLVCKDDEKYCLTNGGKRFCAYIEGGSGKKSRFPLLGILAVIYDEVEDRYLVMKRTKEPFYGVWGLVGGKMGFDDYIEECGRREILEETGLECDVELKGIFSSKTYCGEELGYNHQMFVVLGRNPRGELKKGGREGDGVWMSLGEIEGLDSFPDVVPIIKMVRENGFGWLEMDKEESEEGFGIREVLREKGWGNERI
ncbi:NUDIX domain-containing protein [Methanococcoides sp. SA1]|nr:NUDIX domain-containing protein [Methanococcoides sp. SA1]